MLQGLAQVITINGFLLLHAKLAHQRNDAMPTEWTLYMRINMRM